MKKILIAILLISSSLVKAQWTNNGTAPNYTFVHYLPTTANVVIGANTNQSFKLSINGTASSDRKFGINGSQVLFLPDQSASFYFGSIAIGNGLTALSHTTSTEGQYNTAVGINSIVAATTGSHNTGAGVYSIQNTTTGTWNTGFGVNTLRYNISGKWNTAIGGSALINSTGDYNTALGMSAGENLASGGYNTFIGSITGWGITTGSKNTIIGANVTGLSSSLSNTVIIADGDGNRRIYIDNTGKVGIGTISPGSALDVKGTIRLSGSTSGYVGFAPAATAGSTTYTLPSADGTNGQQLSTNGAGVLSWTSASGSTWITNGSNIQNSNYASGTSGVMIGNVTNVSPLTAGTYKLLVAGGILTEKIKAALQSGGNWSDFVFEKDYKLKSLEEVEKYIQLNKHLPGIPSAQQLVDDGGIDMNEMFAKQMQKIEELTLYIIEIKKEIKDLQKENKSLKSALPVINK